MLVNPYEFAVAGGGGANGFYRTVTIDHTKVGASDATDFPVLLSFTDTTFKTVANGGHVDNTAGKNSIRPYSDVGLTTLLKFEWEVYGATTGNVIMHIKVPTVSHTSDTVFYLKYGATADTTDVSDAPNVWDTNFKVVHHYTDGSTLSVADSTSSGANGVKSTNGVDSATGSPTATTGVIDGGMDITANEYLYVVEGAFPASNLTASFWVTPGSNSGQKGLFETTTGTPPNVTDTFPFMLIQNNAGTLQFYADGNYRDTSQTLSVGTPCLLHVTWSKSGGTSTWKFYKNASLLSTYTATPGDLNHPPGSTANLCLGIGFNGFTTAKYDEFRWSHSTRGPDWITAEWNNQNAPGSFSTLGGEVAI
jgi:hypothetical protein